MFVEEPSRYIDRHPSRAWQRFKAAAEDGGEDFAAAKWLAKLKNGALLRHHICSIELTLTCKSHLSDCLVNTSLCSSQLPKHQTQICQFIPIIVAECLFELSQSEPFSPQMQPCASQNCLFFVFYCFVIFLFEHCCCV